MEKYNLVLDLPSAFYEDGRFKKYFDWFETRAHVRRTAHQSAGEFRPDLEWADAVIMWTFPEFSREDLRHASHLKYIGKLNSTRATVEAAHEAGIQLSDMRGCYSESVAELALAHILNVYRMTGRHVANMKNGNETWVIRAPIDFDSRERVLKGARVGIVGFGGIGRNLARFLTAFSCEISASDPYVSAEQMAANGVKACGLEDIFALSDIVVVCAANNTGTEKLVNRKLIGSLKPGALFINCGRAILLDNDALLERIRREDIDVCLDVFETEPLPKDDPLRGFDRVYLTPHRGGLLASFLEIFDRFVTDLEGVMERGEQARWPVPLEQIHSLRDYK
jgi:phosphoglycerate dehydrogenase-like enzyme